MNIQALRYIIAIEHTGSINKASQMLYVSQSSLSRAIKEIESSIGITLFHRTNKGVTATHDGQQFINQSKRIIQEIDQLESQYFTSPTTNQGTLLIATQRCTPVIQSFIKCCKENCTNQEFLNLALLEETTDNIIQLISNKICGIGILHYTSDQESEFLKKCESMNLEYHILDKSPVCAQVRCNHPLAKYDHISLDMLDPYPHITFSDEDITSINYCSDISQYNPALLKKRIVIQDRGTLRQIISQTDSYYIGCDFSRLSIQDDTPRKYIPLKDINFTLNTIWIRRKRYAMSSLETTFISILESFYSENM